MVQISLSPLRWLVKAMRQVLVGSAQAGDQVGSQSPAGWLVRLVNSPSGVVTKMSPAPARSDANTNCCCVTKGAGGSVVALVACVSISPGGVRVTLGLGWLVSDCVGAGKEVDIGRVAPGDKPTQVVRTNRNMTTTAPIRSAASFPLRWWVKGFISKVSIT